MLFKASSPTKEYSHYGLNTLILCIAAMVVLSIADGLIRGYIFRQMSQTAFITMLTAWIVNFRYLFEQGIYAATVFFVGMKFLETRTVFSVSFDRLDNAKMSVKGPDDDNVVWIGHAYATNAEAQVVAEALTERLKQSAA